MGNKALAGGGPVDKPDGIERITNALFTGLMGIVLLCALLPVFISQIAGLSSDEILSGWDGLGGFTSTLVGILVGAVILGAMITIFAGITIPESFANAAAIESMIQLIPLIAAVGLLLAGIFYFISRK